MPSYCRVLNKSCPRNQRYLHPRFFGAGVFVCKVDEGSKFAEQLDPEIFIIGNEAYFLDDGALFMETGSIGRPFP